MLIIILSEANPGDNLTITNNGEATCYDLETEYIRKDSQGFMLEKIHIDSGETQCMTPASWDNLNSSKVRLDIDSNSDGTWDKYLDLTQKTRVRVETPGFEISIILTTIVFLVIFLRRRRGY